MSIKGAFLLLLYPDFFNACFRWIHCMDHQVLLLISKLTLCLPMASSSILRTTVGMMIVNACGVIGCAGLLSP